MKCPRSAVPETLWRTVGHTARGQSQVMPGTLFRDESGLTAEIVGFYHSSRIDGSSLGKVSMVSDTASRPLALWSWANKQAKESRLLIWLALLALSSLFAMQVLRGSVLYEGWVQDIFIHLNGILNIQSGNLPHTGFSTPVGPFYYLAHYLTTYFAPPSAFTAVYANGFVAALAALFSLLVGYRRLHPGWTAILILYVGIVAISPRQLGHLFLTFNATYNRWSWAFFAVLAILVSIPPADAERPRAAVQDGALTGVLLGLLFFTKVTYAAVGLGLVLVSLGTVRRSAHPLLYILATVMTAGLLVLLVELRFGIVFPYFADLHRAAQVPGVNRIQQLIMIAYVTTSDQVAIFLVAAIAAAASGARLRLSNVVYLLVLVLAGLAIATQNHIAPEIPLTPAVALVAYRLFHGPEANPRVPLALRLAASIAVAGLFARALALDTITIVEESLAPAAPGSDVDWLRDTPLHALAFKASNTQVVVDGKCTAQPWIYGLGREYFAIVQDGVRLLKEHRSGDGRVLSLTWSNPFPLILGGQPPRHDLSWWDSGRTFTSTVHPPARELFRDVKYVMIPRYQGSNHGSNPPTADLMLSIYGSEIERNYKLLGESGCWRLMGRIEPAERP